MGKESIVHKQNERIGKGKGQSEAVGVRKRVDRMTTIHSFRRRTPVRKERGDDVARDLTVPVEFVQHLIVNGVQAISPITVEGFRRQRTTRFRERVRDAGTRRRFWFRTAAWMTTTRSSKA